MATAVVAVEHTTALALGEKAKLKKALRRVDMLGFLVCAFVGLDTSCVSLIEAPAFRLR